MVVPVVVLAYVSVGNGNRLSVAFSPESEAVWWPSETDAVCNRYVDALIRWCPMVARPVYGLIVTRKCLGVLANGW